MARVSELTKIAVTFPTGRILDVTEAILAIQGDIQEAGDVCQVDIIRNASLTPRRRESDAPPVAGDTLDLTGAEGEAQPVQAQRRSANTRVTRRAGNNAVVYRVVDPTIKVTPRNQEVRMVLLKKGPMSARQLEEATGLGQKVIQSSLWGLRNAKSVESVEDNGKVTQRKFSAAQIKAAGTGK